jgi:phage gp45-like
MAMRTTLKDTGRRTQTNSSRGTLRKMNSKPYWSEVDIDVMTSETHTGVEFVENYGSTSFPANQDEEEDDQKQPKAQQQASGSDGPGGGGAGSEGEQGEQPKGDAAEPVIMYLNGSRSHPVVIAMGDRRHRLTELEEGDVANHRLKDDRQQFLMSKDGTYLTTRNDKVFRAALVPKKEDKQQTPSQQQQADAGGGGSSGSGGGKQKKQKTYGQKSDKDDNKKSSVAIEQNGTQTYSQHGESYGTQKGGSDSTIHYEKNKKKSAQTTEEHTHIRFKDHRIFNDEGGNWATSPIQIKMDKYCKEG